MLACCWRICPSAVEIKESLAHVDVIFRPMLLWIYPEKKKVKPTGFKNRQMFDYILWTQGELKSLTQLLQSIIPAKKQQAKKCGQQWQHRPLGKYHIFYQRDTDILMRRCWNSTLPYSVQWFTNTRTCRVSLHTFTQVYLHNICMWCGHLWASAHLCHRQLCSTCWGRATLPLQLSRSPHCAVPEEPGSLTTEQAALSRSSQLLAFFWYTDTKDMR